MKQQKGLTLNITYVIFSLFIHSNKLKRKEIMFWQLMLNNERYIKTDL